MIFAEVGPKRAPGNAHRLAVRRIGRV